MYNRRKDMSKKAFKELQKQNRATNGFNTGTRTHKTDKHPSRARRKEMEEVKMEKLKLLEGECIITIPQMDIEQMFLDYREHVREVNKEMGREEEL